MVFRARRRDTQRPGHPDTPGGRVEWTRLGVRLRLRGTWGRLRAASRHGPPISPPPSGSASVGRAGSGRASVPVPPAAGGAPAGRASVGNGSSGRASVGSARPVSPASAGRASVGGSSGRASVGSAAVGGAAVGGMAGRATVARASVSPPGGPGPDTGGPAGPTGPGRRSRSRNEDPDARRRAKKRKRVNILIASFAVLVMLVGGGVVGFTYYSTKVPVPDQLPMPLATTVYTYDMKTVVAKLGNENREFVTIKDIPEYVQKAVAAAEDRNFYEHSGVDYKGIARAAWNNFTGGSKQGASTITQQYARNAYESLKDDTYARKVKEAILASKLNEKYDKPTIMQHYLNTIYFGRNAYGIEAASKAYFGKSVSKLTPAEGAVLASVIKQPEPSATHKGYDPAINLQAAQERWTYVVNGMVEKGWLDPAQKPTAYPTIPKIKQPDFSVKTPKGNVVNYVRQELDKWGLCTDTEQQVGEKPTCSNLLRSEGYRIRTTIDAKKQNSLEAVIRQNAKGSELADQPKNLMAAAVSIDPKTGRVLAYYGGDDGTGFDYAGKNMIGGQLTGGHPPGSSFKVYTLAAALDAGISVNSHWDAKPFKPKGFANEVQNAGRDVSANGRCNRWCTLQESTVQSYNVPFYHVSTEIGPDKIVDIARRAGITTMWTTSDNPPKPIDLTKEKPEKVAPDPFYHVVGYGQYPVTVLDHANGLATLANQGKYNKAHFVYSVEKQNEETGKWEKVPGTGEKLSKTGGQQVIKAEVAREVSAVLKEIPGKNSRGLDDGRPAAGKTGTWEYDSKDNAHAWMVGYTPQLATAVWVGSKDSKKPWIRDKNDKDIGGSALPGAIWQRYMNAALKGADKSSLPDITNIGDQSKGNGIEPPPPPPVTPPPGQNPNPPCLDPLNILCRDGGGTPGGPGGPTNPGTPPGPGGGGGGDEVSPPPRYSDDD
ncbi:membrane peptidoglycan carboxypeptidase [Micromonospora sagamiensis]|uniref:Membrane peptidoglycan carboxypeptidase n=1 Tax=Micromonospora sagamiensis TaxID=47875 RepID=A0A562WPK5_9ACTN|nr:membrane peptidoglycan carboxypeptidase [Micromonospora sagamiensis]